MKGKRSKDGEYYENSVNATQNENSNRHSNMTDGRGEHFQGENPKDGLTKIDFLFSLFLQMFFFFFLGILRY